MTTPVWISLGGNLGDRAATLDLAVAALAASPGVVVRAVSSYHETEPVGGPAGQPAFLNAAARLDTTLGPFQLLDLLHEIENRARRVREVRWGARTLDLDLLIFGTKFLDDDKLKLPHPRLALRRFVLAPLAEIAPTIVDTITRRSIADLLANLDREPRFLALVGLPGPLRTAVFDQLRDQLPALGVRWSDLYPDLDSLANPLRCLPDFYTRHVDDPSRPQWVVADYLFEVNGFDYSENPIWSPRFDHQSEEEWIIQKEAWAWLVEKAKQARLPTLAVALPGERTLPRRPGVLRTPVLWPEANDPDAIVAEVVATCRSIAGI